MYIYVSLFIYIYIYDYIYLYIYVYIYVNIFTSIYLHLSKWASDKDCAVLCFGLPGWGWEPGRPMTQSHQIKNSPGKIDSAPAQ